MDRGAWRATVHGVVKSWTQLSTPTRALRDPAGVKTGQFSSPLSPGLNFPGGFHSSE